MSNINDRAVQALVDDAWEGEWDYPISRQDLANGVALVLRTVRDDLIQAWQAGAIANDLLDVERVLNDRITALSGRPTTTGDTT